MLLHDEDDSGTWRTGVSNYWGMVLFNRMLRVAEYRNALTEKMERLHATITPALIASEIAKYRTVVDSFTQRMPDSINLYATTEQLEMIYRQMPFDVNANYQNFLVSLQKPMPFFLGDVTREDDQLALTWGEAYSFSPELVTYTVQIAADWSFSPEALVYESDPQLQINTTVPMLPAGDYCWRVIARNESGYEQLAFDYFVTGDQDHMGTRRFTITDAGEVLHPE